LLQLALNPPRLDQVLSQDTDLGPVVQKAKDLAALYTLCLTALPPQLAAQIQGVNLKDRRLTLLVTNAAAAAKVKLVSATLCGLVSQERPEVKSVSVRVQPTTSRKRDVATHKSTRFSAPALAHLSALHARLSDSPAKRALAALLAHQDARVTPPRKGAQTPVARAGERLRKPRR